MERPPARPSQRRLMEAIHEKVRACELCMLCETRTNAVPGEGSLDPEVMVIGEAPGAEEDLQGRPFVGRSGKLLRQKLTEVFGEEPSWFYITNVIKCRPPDNRDPQEDEVIACRPYLMAQIAALNPKVIICVGRHASTQILGKPPNTPMRELRGKIVKLADKLVVCTYHPSYLLRNPRATPDFISDLGIARRALRDYDKIMGKAGG